MVKSNKYRAVKTFSMVNTAYCFKIFITGFNRKFTTSTFRLKHSSKIYNENQNFRLSAIRNYLRYNMVDLLQYEMFLNLMISCMQHIENIQDAKFFPMHEYIPIMIKSIESFSMNSYYLLSIFFENILHNMVRDIVRNLVHNIAFHFLQQNHTQ